jgi:hypothetical protein
MAQVDKSPMKSPQRRGSSVIMDPNSPQCIAFRIARTDKRSPRVRAFAVELSE